MWIELVVGSLRLGADDHMLNHSSRAAKWFLVSQTTLHYKGMKRSKISRFVRSPLCGLFQDRFPDVNLRPCLLFFPFRVALILNTRRAQPWWGERRGEGRVKWAHLRPQYCHSNEYSWFGTTWHGGHDGGQYNKKLFQRIDMKMDFSSQRREVLLVLTTNISSRRDFAWKLAIISSCEPLRDTDVK